MKRYEPLYVQLWRKGELDRRVRAFNSYLKACQLCPRECLARRDRDETGVCGAGKFPIISSHGPHFGEEPPLVGTNGSGTVFFGHCNLLCIFCQNYDISHFSQGVKGNSTQLAAIFLQLQKRGCHNLNLVTPTHYVPQIVSALAIAVQKGFRLPIVYNCGGYENVEVIRLLDGIVDIYMPDCKFFDSERSRRFLDAEDYPQVVRAVLREMHRQVGDLTIDEFGIARQGMLIRYLVMPGTKEAELDSIFKFIAQELSKESYVNIMAQYRPLYKARQETDIARPITAEEFELAIEIAKKAGLTRGF